MKLDGKGRASLKVDFTSRRVTKVTITLVNASTRFRCFRQTSWSCSGNPKDDGAGFTLRAVARK